MVSKVTCLLSGTPHTRSYSACLFATNIRFADIFRAIISIAVPLDLKCTEQQVLYFKWKKFVGFRLPDFVLGELLLLFQSLVDWRMFPVIIYLPLYLVERPHSVKPAERWKKETRINLQYFAIEAKSPRRTLEGEWLLNLIKLKLGAKRRIRISGPSRSFPWLLLLLLSRNDRENPSLSEYNYP